MFGHYFRNIDDKNRVLVPSKLRDKFGKFCYITLDLDNILVMRSEETFEVWSDKLMNLNSLNASARKMARALLGSTFKVELDKQGRLSLPPEAIKASDLTKEVAFVGVGKKIEIHSKAHFDKLQKEISVAGSLEKLAEKLLKDGAEL